MMQQIILSLHVMSAILLWLLSASILIKSSNIDNVNDSNRKIRQLTAGIVITALFGLITALSYSNFSLFVCVKIGLYLSPSLIALGVLILKQRKILSERSN